MIKKIKYINYKQELEKYKKARAMIKQEQQYYKERQKQKEQQKTDDFYSFPQTEEKSIKLETEDNLQRENNIDDVKIEEFPTLKGDSHKILPFEEQLKQLEEKEMITFQEEYPSNIEYDFFDVECFLYHGLRYYDDSIRFEEGLKKLKGIFEKKEILAGKYLDGYYPSSDNCNESEYISLAKYSDGIEFEVFILENICLLTSPSSDAYQTIYVSCDMWDFIKENQIKVKNRYSYAHNEYQIKDSIPIEDVKAIGLPHFNIRLSEGLSKADYYKQQIIGLLNRYDIDLPIVDTSCYNQIIYQKGSSKKLQK